MLACLLSLNMETFFTELHPKSATYSEVTFQYIISQSQPIPTSLKIGRLF